MSFFEAAMLVCFGASWPFAVCRTWRSKTARGKSFVFLVLIFVGYLSGTVHKLIYSRDWIISLYVLNAVLVFADLVLSWRYLRQERKDCSVS